ncbi:MAG: hypothetical protein IT210_22660 [Armatimonadetes bacterium]|nr:hypothetical protein [Armatimonadota bacterium]
MFRLKARFAGFILVILASGFLIPTAAFSRRASRQITNLVVSEQPEKTLVSVIGNGPLRFRQGRLTRPERIYFDFLSTGASGKEVKTPEAGSPIRTVVLKPHAARHPWVRVTVTMRAAPSARVFLTENGSRLNVEVASNRLKAAPAPTKAIKTEAPTAPAENAAPPAAITPPVRVAIRPVTKARAVIREAPVLRPAEKPRVVRPLPSITRLMGSGSGSIDMDFVNAELSDIAKALSIQSGQNVAVSGTSQGKATLRLRKASLQEALRLVASLNSLDYRKIDNTYIIAKPEELKRLAASSGVRQTYITKNIAPEDAKKLLEATYPHLTVEAQTQTATITLIGLSEDMDQVMQTLSQVDVAKAAVTVSEAVVPKYIAAEALAETLQAAFPQVSLRQQEKAIVLSGSKTNVDKAVQAVKALDVESAVDTVQRVVVLKYITAGQVEQMLKAIPDVKATAGPETYAPPTPKFTAITATDTFQSSGGGAGGGMGGGMGGMGGGMGGAGAGQAQSGAAGDNKAGSSSKTVILVGSSAAIDRAVQLIEAVDEAPPQVMIEAKLIDISPEESSNLGISWPQSYALTLRERPGRQDIAVGSFSRDMLNIEARLNAAVSSKKAKILANPSIAVLDNQDANIFIGDMLRYTVLVSITATGSQFDVRDVPVGIILLVRPRISPDGFITMKVHPVVSTVTAMVETPNGSIPQTSSREADSTIRVRDGETFVIGGLLREEDLKTVSKVPILGDIPFFGQLFQNREKTHRRSEVMVFLTPRIMKNQ